MSDHPVIHELIAQGEEQQAFEHAGECDACRTALLQEGLYPAGCDEPVLGYQVLLHLEVLAEFPEKAPETARRHADGCAACAAEVADGREALGELEGFAAAVVEPSVPSKLAIGISCVFCHDHFDRQESVYCATCLAPYHPACFTDHGRCSVLGCEETRFVRPHVEHGVVDPEPAPRHRFRRWVVGGLFALAVGGAAALLPGTRDTPGVGFDTSGSNAPADPVVARVNDQPILRSDLERACALQPGFLELAVAYGSGRTRVQLAELDSLIEEQVLLQRARAEGISLTADQEAELAPFLAPPEAAHLLSTDYLIARARERRLIEALLERELPGVEQATVEEVERYYERHRRSFHHGGETRLREIVIYVEPKDAQRVPPKLAEDLGPEGGLWDARAIAGQLKRAKPWLVVTSSFSESCELYSMGSGEVQVFSTDDMREVLIPPLGDVVNDLEEGDVSPLVECYTGSFHIVQLVSRRAAASRSLAEVAREIRAVLRRERSEEQRRAFVNERLAEARIETFLSTTAR